MRHFTGISRENGALEAKSVERRSAEQYDIGAIAGPTLVEGETPLFLDGSVMAAWNQAVINLDGNQVVRIDRSDVRANGSRSPSYHKQKICFYRNGCWLTHMLS